MTRKPSREPRKTRPCTPAVVMAALLLAAAAPATYCQQDPPPAADEPQDIPAEAPDEPLVTNSFFNQDVRQALADVAADTGITILQDESVAGFISIELEDVPLQRALRLMLLPLGLVFVKIEPDVYLVTSVDPKAASFHLVAKSRIVPLAYLDPQNVVKLLPDRLGQYVRVDVEGRQCIVQAPEDLLEEIVALIRSLDRMPKQVMIEALVVEMTAGSLRKFAPTFARSYIGADIAGGILTYQSNPGSAPGQHRATDPGIAPVPGNFLLHLHALLRTNRAVLRANPRIVAPDGKPAEIEVGTQQYFSLLTGSAVYAYTRLEKVDATIKLTILPRVLPDTGEVLCEIEPNISDVVGQGPDGLPVITIRRAKSSIRVRSGQAIVIGGLLQEGSSIVTSKVPILGDIPIIGSLFRSRTRERTQRDIVFLISPHILDADGQVEGPLLSEILMSGKAPTVPQEVEGTRPAEPPAATPAPAADQKRPAVRSLREAFGVR